MGSSPWAIILKYWDGVSGGVGCLMLIGLQGICIELFLLEICDAWPLSSLTAGETC